MKIVLDAILPCKYTILACKNKAGRQANVEKEKATDRQRTGQDGRQGSRREFDSGAPEGNRSQGNSNALGKEAWPERGKLMRGDGRIFQRGAWKWVAYCYEGREYREPAKTRDGKNTNDGKEAEKFLQARLKEKHAAEVGAMPFVSPTARRLTVADLCAALKADFELRGKASGQNLSHLARVERDFGELRALALTPERIDAYIEERLGEKRGPKTEVLPGDRPASVNRTLQMLGQAFNLAVRRGTLSRVPYIRHLSEAGNARRGFFTEQELAAVIEHLPAGLKDFTRFCVATGMRKGEASGLTWAMVEDNELHIPAEICKNRQSRVLPLAGELAEIIKRRQVARRVEEKGTVRMVEFVFHRDGTRIGDFKKSWATATRKAGVPGRLFHDLRRFAVRAMVKAGINPQIAKRWSGHVSDSMFQRYSILTTDDLRNAFTQTEQYRATEQAKIVPIAAQK